MKLAWTVLSVAKAGCGPAENEDALAVEAGRAAVCDGASEGWGSGLWARHLAEALVSAAVAPPNFAEWLDAVRQSFTPAPAVSWYAEAKLAVGAFSTLLGVAFSPVPGGGLKFHAVAVGDTGLFHVRADKLLAGFPVETASEFGNRPALVGSGPGAGVEPAWFAGRAESGDRFYLLTDALAEWFLRSVEAGTAPWQVLDAVSNAAEFENWVQSQRANKHLKNDDTTLVRTRIVCDPEVQYGVAVIAGFQPCGAEPVDGVSGCRPERGPRDGDAARGAAAAER